ncbi:MAG: ABC-type sugar transport system, periplasmic component [Herbinix sp.]|nr:ABC-type sugar transport system, periplasmic component [Herbinix sp.]
MFKKIAALVLCVSMSTFLFVGCGKGNDVSTGTENQPDTSQETEVTEAPESETPDFAGQELSILVSAGWMDNRYDATIARFEEEYGVTVDLQTIPADQYSDILKSKLSTDTLTDIFWIQSDPFAIGSQIVDPEKYCLDFTGAEWASVMPTARLASCSFNGKLFGLQLWHNSPEYVMLYNKSLFDENGWTIPATYAEFKDLCAKIAEKGVTPWFVPGADGWQHQLSFFQIGGVYEEATPGLYDGLNNNTATFADNAKMLEVLEQFKELANLGYFGEDWIGTDSTNMANDFGDRNIAMAMANSSYIKQIQEETGTADEFGLFLIPLGDNTYFPTNPGGPTMFGSASSEHPDLVKAFFSFVTTTESMQEILDNSPQYTNMDVIDANVQQHWLPEEEAFMSTIPAEKMEIGVLQTATKYTNNYWMNFGADMVSFCLGEIEANDVLKNMDANRAEAAKAAGDSAWGN